MRTNEELLAVLGGMDGFESLSACLHRYSPENATHAVADWLVANGGTFRDPAVKSLSDEITLLRTVVGDMAECGVTTEYGWDEGAPERAAFNRALAEPRNRDRSEEWDNPEGLTLNGDGRP